MRVNTSLILIALGLIAFAFSVSLDGLSTATILFSVVLMLVGLAGTAVGTYRLLRVGVRRAKETAMRVKKILPVISWPWFLGALLSILAIATWAWLTLTPLVVPLAN